jgi:hypothetical protein
MVIVEVFTVVSCRPIVASEDAFVHVERNHAGISAAA